MAAANRTGSMTLRSQYSGRVTSSVATVAVTPVTSGTRGVVNLIWRTTRSYSASIGFMSGEWKACDTVSAFAFIARGFESRGDGGDGRPGAGDDHLRRRVDGRDGDQFFRALERFEHPRARRSSPRSSFHPGAVPASDARVRRSASGRLRATHRRRRTSHAISPTLCPRTTSGRMPHDCQSALTAYSSENRAGCV